MRVEEKRNTEDVMDGWNIHEKAEFWRNMMNVVGMFVTLKLSSHHKVKCVWNALDRGRNSFDKASIYGLSLNQTAFKFPERYRLIGKRVHAQFRLSIDKGA